MGFIRLTREERKKICKYVNFDDFKKSNNKNMKYKAKVKTIIGKSFDKFQYSDMINYINEHIEEDEAESIVADYLNYIRSEFVKEFKELIDFNKQMADYLSNLPNPDEYVNKDEVVQFYEMLDAYQDQYNIESIEYDLFKRFYIVDSKEEVDEYIANKEKEYTEEQMKKKLGELEDKVEGLEEELEKKKADAKVSEEAVSELSEQLQKYQTALSLDNTRYKLSNILRVNITAMTEKEIYEKLNEEEEKALEKEDYDRVKQLLAAKYFMITAKEVE